MPWRFKYDWLDQARGFPALSPDWRTPLRDTIPWATLRLSKPFSDVSAASLRIADSRRLMEGGTRLGGQSLEYPGGCLIKLLPGDHSREVGIHSGRFCIAVSDVERVSRE
jgi:hypothetical protein